MADNFCRFNTGIGYSKRELYADDEEVIFTFARPVFLAGTSPYISQGDLADRCVAIELKRIPKGKRKEKDDMMPEFRKRWPSIFGALLDNFVVGLRNIKSVKIEADIRMVGFAKWGVACSGDAFLDAYLGASEEQAREALGRNLVFRTLMSMLYNECVTSNIIVAEKFNIEVEGSMSFLYEKILRTAQVEDKYVEKSKGWPQGARALSAWFTRNAVLMEKIGIRVHRGRKNKGSQVSLVIPKEEFESMDYRFKEEGEGINEKRCELFRFRENLEEIKF
jgi:hypothetical protein